MSPFPNLSFCKSVGVNDHLIATTRLNMLRVTDDSIATTDLRRWRLECTHGAHNWRYLTESDVGELPQSFAEKYFLGLPTV